MRLWSGIIAVAALAACAAQPALAQDPSSPDVAGIIAKLHNAAVARGLPAEIAEAVGFVETGFDPTRIGAAGEIGLMQVMPPTAAQLGFDGTNAELADVDTNIRYGTQYLASAWELAGHDLCRTLNKYRAGHNSESMSPASVSYCQRAQAYLAKLGSPLAVGVIIPTVRLAAIGDAPQARLRLGVDARGSAGFWPREQARVRKLQAKVRERWALIAAYNARLERGRPQRGKPAQLIAELRTLR